MIVENIYRIIFENYSKKRPSTKPPKNVVWLDIGDTIDTGYFDHHAKDCYYSTVDVVVKNTRLLKNLKTSYTNIVNGNSKDKIEVHMHKCPDLDCIISFYIVKAFLELPEDEFEKSFGKEGSLSGLVDYANDIDTGKGKVVSHPTLYALFCSIDANMKKCDQTDALVIEKGLQLLTIATELMRENPTLDLRTYDFSKSEKTPKDFNDTFKNEISFIENSYSIFKQEQEENIVSFEKIGLWTIGGELKEASAAIWKKVSNSYFGYIHARNEGNLFTVVPYAIKGENGDSTTRVFASLDPEANSEENFTLLPIAEIIEQMEQVEEQAYFEKNGRYRRNYSCPRNSDLSESSENNLSKFPFAATSDPWYINPKEDLFDSPGEQSILDYKDILEIIRNNGSTVKRSATVDINTDNKIIETNNKEPEAEQPLNKWLKKTSEQISSSSESCHHFVFAEIDASLICHNNKILETICSNILGYSCKDNQIGRLMFFDYRTCIYCSLNCTIVLVATYKINSNNESSYGNTAISKVLDVSSYDKLIESKFIINLKNICIQRADLLKFGKQIGNLQSKKRKRKYIENLSEKLLEHSIKAQEEGMIDNQVERELYNFIKEEFQIEKLSSSIMNEIGILVNDSRERLVSKFNIISGIAVPFILIATVFQTGIIKFDPIIELSDINSVIGWGIVALIVALLTIRIIFGGTKDNDD